MKTKFKKGMTLVEIMAAVGTGSFVVLAAGIIMTFGQQSWNNEWKRACLERDLSCVMTEITQPIKEATSATADPNGKILVINNDGNSIQFSLVSGQNILQKSLNGGTEIEISNKVQNVTFTSSGKTVTTNLTLEDDGIQTSTISTVMMRNYGG